MSELAIRAEGLGKLYHIGARQPRYRTLRETITDLAAAPFRRAAAALRGRAAESAEEDLWALKDVAFEIKRGEVAGVIGRNGAGKSTLLKILSRITEPTVGRVGVKGRVGSLLEVGTGFHPELTGRENIYLNGAILGMRRAEIARKFDEIVAFAEIEKFLDTPVKHYSSGMYMRLAFAVAAHLEPEVLLVDEVLAVGDAEFQKKCLGKMGDVAKGGRTVLFVSHNMHSINRLCKNAILLDGGTVKGIGPVQEITSKYLSGQYGKSSEKTWNNFNVAPGDTKVKLLSVKVTQDGETTDSIDIKKPVILEMEFYNYCDGAKLLSAFSLFNEDGVHLFVAGNFSKSYSGSTEQRGKYISRCEIPGNIFTEGRIDVTPEISTREPVYEIHAIAWDAVSFQVVDMNEKGSVRDGWGRNIPGVMRPMCNWLTTYQGDLGDCEQKN